MSRSLRRINNRSYGTLGQDRVHTERHPESMCKPGCGVCGKGPKHRRQRSKARRAEARHVIAEETA